MDDLLDDPADVAVALGEVERAQLGGVLVQIRVRLELLRGRAIVSGVPPECSEIRTMACERLCALITRPMVYLRVSSASVQ